MGIPESQPLVSVDAYLDGEEQSEIRHEYIGGQVYAISGGSESHNLICGNLYSAIRQHLRGSPCKVFMYVLIDQGKPAVTRFRQENGWKPEHLSEGDSLSLPSIGFEQSLADLYEDVEWSSD